MPKRKTQRLSTSRLILIITAAFAGFSLLLALLVRDKNIALFNAKGMIAREQQSLLIFIITLVMVFAVPTVTLLFFTAWKYRESNTKAKRAPNSHSSKPLVGLMWLTPTLFILTLAVVMWSATHRLAPQKSIASDVEPLTIQVVALNWKWLFIYPEQGIATVNYVQIPVDTPIVFELTADEAPMNSFWIPNLGGQLYAMTGHVNRLNLIADTAGDYPGKSAEINGIGFSGMKFTARASSKSDFTNWVQETRQSPKDLDADTYKALLQPSENNPTMVYSSFEYGLYDSVVMKYHKSSQGHENH